MTTTLKIDFVSDIACPWCAVGLGALEGALKRLAPDVSAELHFQPFELNPQMPAGGQDLGEHITEKYGSTPEQQAQMRETIRQRGAAVGFTFNAGGRGRVYNTLCRAPSAALGGSGGGPWRAGGGGAGGGGWRASPASSSAPPAGRAAAHTPQGNASVAAPGVRARHGRFMRPGVT